LFRVVVYCLYKLSKKERIRRDDFTLLLGVRGKFALFSSFPSLWFFSGWCPSGPWCSIVSPRPSWPLLKKYPSQKSQFLFLFCYFSSLIFLLLFSHLPLCPTSKSPTQPYCAYSLHQVLSSEQKIGLKSSFLAKIGALKFSHCIALLKSKKKNNITLISRIVPSKRFSRCSGPVELPQLYCYEGGFQRASLLEVLCPLFSHYFHL